MSNRDSIRSSVEAPKSSLNIDWTREPETERERKIRAVLLRKATNTTPGFGLFSLRNLLNESTTKRLEPDDAASDFREAYAATQVCVDDFLTAERKRRIEDAIREVDGEQAAQ